MDQNDKRFGIFAACVVAALLIIGLINLYQAKNAGPHINQIPYSEFLDDVARGDVRGVSIKGQDITGYYAGNRFFHTIAANDPDLVKSLRAKNVRIDAQPTPVASSWTTALTTLIPTLLFFGLFYYFMRRSSGMGGNTGLGKSRARMQQGAMSGVTFADVAGVDEARDSLQEIVDFLRDPQKFQRLGGRIPKGVLLVGPPGTGKTLLARAIAGEANVPFFTISGSDFVEMFVGVGASRVRAMFEQAKKHAPCIIFMDEIDAVGRKRGAGVGGGNDEREQTLNQLLVEMDGFAKTDDVILIAATNRPDVLDPALLRPGRFDREIVVSNPDVVGREHILGVHVRNMPLEDGVDLKGLARTTPGFSGADIMNLANEAALLAARRGKSSIGRREFEDAKDTVMMGAERRTHVMSEDERRRTAYREGGRAIVALHAPESDPVHKVTIMPRGRSSGMLKQLPEEDQPILSLTQMTSRLAILMAGRAAEEMIFGRANITSGSAKDIEEATKLARDMVTRWGTSEAIGAVAYGENQDEVFLGRSVTRQQNVSEETQQLIAVEIRKLIDQAKSDALSILTARRNELEKVVQALLTQETMSGTEIQELLKD